MYNKNAIVNNDVSPVTSNMHSITPSRDGLAVWIEEEWSRRKQARNNLDVEWLNNINMISGNQYATSEINAISKGYKRQKNVWKTVFNKIRKVAQAHENAIATTKRIPKATPISTSEKDIRNAKITTDVIRHVLEKNDFNLLHDQLGQDVVTYGNAFVLITWDKFAGRTFKEIVKQYQKTKKTMSQEEQEKINMFLETEFSEAREGDILIKRLSPFEIYVDNINREKFDDCTSIMRVKTLDAPVASVVIGQDISKSVDFKIETVSSITKQPKSVYGNNSSMNDSFYSFTELKNQVTFIEFYEKPTYNRPKGRFILYVGGKILHDGELPLENGCGEHAFKTRKFPIRHISAKNAPNTIYGDSLIKDIIPIQKNLNAIRNLQREYLEHSTHGQLIVQSGSIVNPITNDPKAIIEVRRGFQPPTRLVANAMPADSWQEVYALNNELNSMTNLNQVSIHGEGNSQTRSSKQTAMAMEQSQVNMTTIRKSFVYAFSDIGKQIVRIYKQKIMPGETRHIQYSRNLDDNVDWSSDLLTDSIRIDSESSAIMDLESRRQEVAQANILLDSMLAKGITDPKTIENAFNAMEFGIDAAEMLLPNKVHLERARLENRNLKNGTPPVLDKDDNHSVHLKEHIDYKFSLFGDRMRELIESGKTGRAMFESKLLDDHISEHEKIVSRQQMLAMANQQLLQSVPQQRNRK